MKLLNAIGTKSFAMCLLLCQTAFSTEYQKETINLSRTSLCSVMASNVNGQRAMDNRYYGVLNAFDNDAGNIVNNIRYTDWCGSSGCEWVEIRFTRPVKISKVVVEDGPKFSTAMFMDDGSEEAYAEAKDLLVLEQSIDRVTKIRLSFADNDGKDSPNVRVREIRILGNVPAGTEYVTQNPTVIINEDTARLAAAEKFDQWRNLLTENTKVEIKDDKDVYRITFQRQQDELILYQVIIDKETGAVTAEPLSELRSKET